MSRKIDGNKFANATTARPRFFSPKGSRMANDYEIKIDKKGHKILEKVGEHDTYEEMQSYIDECKIENILARAAAGDMEALNKRQGFYEDITNTPKNLAEAQNEILKLSNHFDSLPAEIRAKFDNSKERFVHLYGTEEWLENMGFTKPTEKAVQQSFNPETENIKEEILTPEGN